MGFLEIENFQITRPERFWEFYFLWKLDSTIISKKKKKKKPTPHWLIPVLDWYIRLEIGINTDMNTDIKYETSRVWPNLVAA